MVAALLGRAVLGAPTCAVSQRFLLDLKLERGRSIYSQLQAPLTLDEITMFAPHDSCQCSYFNLVARFGRLVPAVTASLLHYFKAMAPKSKHALMTVEYWTGEPLGKLHVLAVL